MDIEQALVAHISSDEKLREKLLAVDNIGEYVRLFPLAMPQDETPPAIVYQRISTPRTLSLTGESASNPRIQLSCYAERFSDAKELAKLLYDSLDYFRGTLGGKTKAAILMADSRDDYEPDTGRYRCDVDFFVMHSKNKE